MTMDVIPVRLGPNRTRRLVELLRDPALDWRLRAGGDACHPSARLVPDKDQLLLAQTTCTPIVMERRDAGGMDADQARREAAEMIEMTLDVSLRPATSGIRTRPFLAAVGHMAETMGRRIDVHARGPWLPVRICVKDDGQPPFGPATLASWNEACAPGLQVTSDLRSRTTVVGSPQSVHASSGTWPECPTIDLMRTIALLEELVLD
jgi:hypothetical protein